MTTSEHIENATCDATLTRQRRDAYNGGAMASLHIYREDLNKSYTGYLRLTGKLVVSWTVNGGRGWGKTYRAKFDSEAAAIAFADTKWPVMLAWIEKAEQKAA